MSEWLGWIIALVVIGMAAYPILQIVPSPRQKQIINLRQAAITRGMKVQVHTPRLPEKLEKQYYDFKHCTGYQLPFDNDHKSQFLQTCLALRSASNSSEWFWPHEQRPPVALLESLLEAYSKLPEYCMAVEQSQVGTALFWKESGDEQRIEEMQQHLAGINAIVSKPKPSPF